MSHKFVSYFVYKSRKNISADFTYENVDAQNFNKYTWFFGL